MRESNLMAFLRGIIAINTPRKGEPDYWSWRQAPICLAGAYLYLWMILWTSSAGSIRPILPLLLPIIAVYLICVWSHAPEWRVYFRHRPIRRVVFAVINVVIISKLLLMALEKIL